LVILLKEHSPVSGNFRVGDNSTATHEHSLKLVAMHFYKSFDEMVQAVIDGAILEDAGKLLKAGADLELVLLFLRDRGLNQGDSIIAMCALTAMQQKSLFASARLGPIALIAFSICMTKHSRRFANWLPATIRDY
jgi:hypothetical protein